MKIHLAIVTLALSAGLAQAGPPPQAAPHRTADDATVAGVEMSKAEVTKWLTFFDQLVDAVVRNQNSCEKMATDVSHVIDANQDSLMIARTARLQHKKLPQAAQDHMLEGVRKMGPGIENCGDNEHVKTAFGKLEVDGDK